LSRFWNGKWDKPYLFGLHQCASPRTWTTQEERLFEEIGRRLADALSSLQRNNRMPEALRLFSHQSPESGASHSVCLAIWLLACNTVPYA
jgi:GAF domain-containing protein